jgi:hypothetical protein
MPKAMGKASPRANRDVMRVPQTWGKIPYTWLTGSQLVEMRNPMPKVRMAGNAWVATWRAIVPITSAMSPAAKQVIQRNRVSTEMGYLQQSHGGE